MIKYQEFNFLGKIFISMRFLYRKIPIQKCFDQILTYLSTDFKNSCCTFYDKLNAQIG